MFNQEEKEMIVHKMQLELNKQGYTDKEGYKLKPDGKYGNKTRGVYEQYKKDNNADYLGIVKNRRNLKELNNLDSPSVSSYKTPLEKIPAFSSYENSLNKLSNNSKQTSNNKNSTVTTQKIVPTKESPRIYYTTFDKPKKVEKRLNNPEIKEKADKVIKDNAQYIKKAAEKFGVNPVILGACIYTEHLLNVDPLDTWTDVFFGNRGIDTSIGISQVRLSTAKRIEDSGYMPKIESSDDGSLISFLGGDENLKRVKALQNPETNIMYAAAYLSLIQDIWKETYPEIDGRTAILSTLYNINEYGTNGPNSNPQPNDFGRVARNSYYDVAELLGL